MEGDSSGEQTFSKYNAGVAIQIRLDALWKLVNQYSISGDFKFWNATLDRIWSELARDIKENEYEDQNLKDGKKIEGYKTKYDKQADSFKCLTKDDINKRGKQYKVLMAKDLFLKRLENHLGKGTAWDDHDEDDF